MSLEVLMLNFAQALGGVSKFDGEVWVVEVPEEEGTRVLFFRLNTVLTEDDSQESLLVCFTRLGDYRGERALQRLEGMLRLAIELRYARIALLEGELVLFALAPEASTEANMLEMVYEVTWMGEQLSKELARL
jgi:hypothetical protein